MNLVPQMPDAKEMVEEVLKPKHERNYGKITAWLCAVILFLIGVSVVGGSAYFVQAQRERDQILIDRVTKTFVSNDIWKQQVVLDDKFAMRLDDLSRRQMLSEKEMDLMNSRLRDILDTLARIEVTVNTDNTKINDLRSEYLQYKAESSKKDEYQDQQINQLKTDVRDLEKSRWGNHAKGPPVDRTTDPNN